MVHGGKSYTTYWITIDVSTWACALLLLIMRLMGLYTLYNLAVKLHMKQHLLYMVQYNSEGLPKMLYDLSYFKIQVKAWTVEAAAQGPLPVGEPPEIKWKVVWKYHWGPHSTCSPGAYKILIQLCLQASTLVVIIKSIKLHLYRFLLKHQTVQLYHERP